MRALLPVLFLACLALGGYALAARQAQAIPNARVDYMPRADNRAEVVHEDQHRRVVRHVLGETTVPALPQRVVSLTTFITDSLLALEVQPVAVEAEFKRPHPPAYLAGRLEGISTVGFGAQIDLEAILDARPDLILCGLTSQARLYKALSQIAPTIFIDPAGAEEKHGKILELAAVLGMRERGELRLKAHLERIAAARAELAPRVQGRTVAAVRVRAMDIQLFSRTERIGPFLFGHAGLGLIPDPRVPLRPQAGWADTLDVECLAELTADHLIVILDRNGTETLAAASRLPTWRAIPAVKNGNLHVVAFSTWIMGEGLLAEEAKLKDVLAIFGGEAPSPP